MPKRVRLPWSRREKVIAVAIVAVLIGSGVAASWAYLVPPAAKNQAPNGTLTTDQNILLNSGSFYKVCTDVTACSNTISVVKWSAVMIGLSVYTSSGALTVAVHGYTPTLLENGTSGTTYPNEKVYGFIATSAATVTVYVNKSTASYYVFDTSDFENTVVTSTYTAGAGSSTGDSTAGTCSATTTVTGEAIFAIFAAKTTAESTMTPGTGSQIEGPEATTTDVVTSESQYVIDSSTGAYSSTNTLASTADWESACVGIEPASVPTAPTGLAASSIATTTLSLSWTDTASQSSYLTAGEVYEASYTTACGTYSGVLAASSPYSSASVTGLTSGDSYCFYVTVSNGTGASAASTAITNITTETVPGAATSFTVYPEAMSTTELNLAWVNSTTGNPVTLANDTLRQWTGSSCSGTATYTNIPTAVTTLIQITGLTSYTAYSYELAQWNSIGIGTWTSCTSATTYGTPTAPTSLAASAEGRANVTLVWSNPTGAGAIANDTIEYGTTTHVYTHWISAGDVGTYLVIGLNPNTEYFFTIVAWTGGAASSNSSQLAVYTQSGIPSAPTNLQITGETATSITLTWTQPSTALGVLTNNTDYWGLTCGASTSSGPGTWSYDVSLGVVTTATISGLSSDTTYCLGVTAWTGGGQGAAVTIMGTTENAAPSAPTHLTYDSASRTTVTMNWTLSSFGSDVNVTVYYTTTASCSGTLTAESVGVATSYTTSGLTAATTYYWEISAWSNGGQGSKSTCTTGATQGATPPMPLDLTALSVSSTTASLAWVNPAGYSLTSTALYLSPANGSCGTWASGYGPLVMPVVAQAGLTGLAPSSHYCAQVQAVDQASPLSHPVNFTTDQFGVAGGGGSVGTPSAGNLLVLGVVLLGVVATVVATLAAVRLSRGRR